MGWNAIGTKTVTSAGTKVQAYTSDPSDATKPLIVGTQVTIQMPAFKSDKTTANPGNIFIYDKASRLGFNVASGDSVTIPGYGALVNPEDFFVDSDTSGAQFLPSVTG